MPKPHRQPGIKSPKPIREDADRKPADDSNPPPEDEFGGGDMCSPEISPPTDDDAPLE